MTRLLFRKLTQDYRHFPLTHQTKTCSLSAHFSINHDFLGETWDFLKGNRLKKTASHKESQNRIDRSIQNGTGTDGVLELYASDKLVKRFLKIDKLTPATATSGDDALRYGVLDENLNGAAYASSGTRRTIRPGASSMAM